MFWTSILEGFKLLLHYEIYIVLSVYSLLHLFILNLTDTRNRYTGENEFSFKKLILETLLSTTAIAIMVYFISPILAGQSGLAHIDNLTSFIMKLPVIIIACVLLYLLLSLIPLVGNHVMTNNGMSVLITGFVAFIGYIGIKENFELLNTSINYKLTKSQIISLLPSFWQTILYLLMVGILSFIGAAIPMLLIKDDLKIIGKTDYVFGEDGRLVGYNKYTKKIKKYLAILLSTLVGMIVLKMVVFIFIQKMTSL